MSNRFWRALPLYAATDTEHTVFTLPRSRRSQAPSPLPDQRVAMLLSTALAGTLPSSVLAIAHTPDHRVGVIRMHAPGVGVGVAVPVGVGVGGTGVLVGVGVIGVG